MSSLMLQNVRCFDVHRQAYHHEAQEDVTSSNSSDGSLLFTALAGSFDNIQILPINGGDTARHTHSDDDGSDDGGDENGNDNERADAEREVEFHRSARSVLSENDELSSSASVNKKVLAGGAPADVPRCDGQLLHLADEEPCRGCLIENFPSTRRISSNRSTGPCGPLTRGRDSAPTEDSTVVVVVDFLPSSGPRPRTEESLAALMHDKEDHQRRRESSNTSFSSGSTIQTWITPPPLSDTASSSCVDGASRRFSRCLSSVSISSTSTWASVDNRRNSMRRSMINTLFAVALQDGSECCDGEDESSHLLDLDNQEHYGGLRPTI